MPIFEFRCKSCNNMFEEFVRSREYKIICPKCNSVEVEKLISIVSHIGSESGGGRSSSCSGCSASNCSSCH